MKKLLYLLITLSILPALAFAGGSQESVEGSGVEKKPIVLRMAHMNAVGDFVDVQAQRFKDLLESETNGAVQVQIFPAGQLGDEKEYSEGMQLGTVDLGYVSSGYLSNLVPEIAVISFPYIFRDVDHADKTLHGDVGKELADLVLEKTNLRVITWTHQAFRDMITVNKRVESLADFKGLKFRSPDIPVYMEMFKAIGAYPTPIPWTETYQALKTRVVDGVETEAMGMISAKLYEVGHYLTRTGHLYGVNSIVMSDKVYQKLPEDIQSAISRVMVEFEPWQRELMEKQTKAAYEELQAKGCEIINIDKKPLQEACQSVWMDLSEKTPTLLKLAREVQETK